MTASAPSTITAENAPRKRRKLSIEEALRWAICDELPKKRQDRKISAPPTSAVHPMWRAGIFGSRIDCWNQDPGFPLAMGDPHPDALVIEQQLEALADVLGKAAVGSARCPLDLSPYPIQAELRGKADIEVMISRALKETPRWLATSAIHGTRPDVGGGPECEAAKSDNGKITLWRTVQTLCGTGPDGEPWYTTHDETAASKGDARDAGLFCKLNWTRTSLDVVEEQLRYAMWRAALAYLVPALQFLTSIEVMPTTAPIAPWLEPEVTAVPVLRSLHPERRALQDTRRPAGRRAAPRRASEVRHIDPTTWRGPIRRMG